MQNSTTPTAEPKPTRMRVMPKIIEKRHHRVGGVERAAAGQRHDDVEQLQRADHRKEDREADHRPEQRQRDVAEALEGAGAVHLRRLEQRLVDALQPGDVEHHVEAEILPQDDDQHRGERPVLVGEQEYGLEPERAGDDATAMP